MPVWSRLFLGLLLLYLPAGPAHPRVAALADPPKPTWTCWDDGTLDPCHNPLTDLVFPSENEGWAVGYAGTILRWDGVDWEKVASPTTQMLKAVASSTPEDVWAVGYNGTFLEYDGTAWRLFQDEAGINFHDISLSGPDSGWAVGQDKVSDQGVIYQWDGITWERVTTMEGESIKGVAAAPDGAAWAIISSDPRLLTWDGSGWSVDTLPASLGEFTTLDKISCDNAGGLWLIATQNGNEKVVIHHPSAGEWEIIPTGSEDFLNQIEMDTPTSGWLSGPGNLYHWDGVQWTLTTSFEDVGGPFFTDLALYPTGRVWALLAYPHGFLFWDGAAWQRTSLDNPAGSNHFMTLGFADRNLGWALGDAGAIWKWNGEIWTAEDSPTDQIFWGMDVLSASQAWAVAEGGTILHWDGVVWTTQLSGTEADLRDVEMTSPEEGWAVGEDCSLLHWVEGQWQPVSICDETQTELWLKSIQMLSPDDGWIVGAYMGWQYGLPYGSVVLHWDGNEWSWVTIPGWVDHDSSAIDLSMTGPDTGWLLERYNPSTIDGLGNVWRYAEGTWAKQAGINLGNFFDIEMVSEEDGWLGGGNDNSTGPVIRHWDGENWNTVDTPSSATIRDIEMVGPQEGWAVGSGGVILRYALPPDPGQVLTPGAYLPIVFR